MRESWSWLALAAAGSLVVGCSALIEVSDKQCTKDSECVSAGLGQMCVANLCVDGSDSSPSMPASMNGKCANDAECTAKNLPRCMNGTCVAEDVAERWLCDASSGDTSGTLQYSFHVLEYVSRQAPKNLTVKACRDNDVGCGEPAAQFTDTSGSGDVTVELPKGFLGFFDVHASNDNSDPILDALSYVTKPVFEDTHDRDLQMVAQSTLTTLSSVAGVGVDPAKGLALVEAFDCTKTPAGGVHFSESQGTSTPFYIVNHIPNKDANISVYDMENNVADGGFVNLTPGFVTFSAQLGVDGPMLGGFNAHVRANTVTFVDMYF